MLLSYSENGLSDESDSAFACVAQVVLIGVVDDVNVGALGHGTAVVGAVPALVQGVGMKYQHASAVVNCHFVVGDAFAGMAETWFEDGVGAVV